MMMLKDIDLLEGPAEAEEFVGSRGAALDVEANEDPEAAFGARPARNVEDDEGPGTAFGACLKCP